MLRYYVSHKSNSLKLKKKKNDHKVNTGLYEKSISSSGQVKLTSTSFTFIEFTSTPL